MARTTVRMNMITTMTILQMIRLDEFPLETNQKKKNIDKLSGYDKQFQFELASIPRGVFVC